MATYAGTPGVQGNITDFPTITSGAGGAGNSTSGYAGAAGGGASGGGAGRGVGNDSGSRGGGGGGGAGGCLDAGGGAGGTGKKSGGAGKNHHTTPTDTTPENAEYGIVGNYGTGGGPNAAGTTGFVAIRRIGRVVPIGEIINCETIAPSSLDIEWEQKQLGEQAFVRTDYVAIDDGTTWFFFGASGYCYTSVDLNTFSAAVTLGISPKSVVLVGNTFVALTSEGLIYTASKSDLTTWTQVADISSIDSLWQGLCVGNGCIIAFGGHIAKSTDTTSWATWNQVTVSGYYYGVTKNGMVWDGTQFCGLQSYASPAFVTSPDGETWTYKGYAAGIMTSDPRLFGYYAGMYIQVSRNGEVWESSDGAQWVQNPSSVPFSRGCAGGFSADGSQIVVVEYGGANLAISNNTIVVDPAQEIDCGLIEDSVVETIDCGKIM
jgi:hypothetical protein